MMAGVPRSAPLALLGTELSARGSAGELAVRLLPHRLFARQCADERPPDAVVLHCYAEKVATDKRFALNASGAWFLRDDFDNASWSRNGSWLDWLRGGL